MRSAVLAEAERIADEDVAINRRMGAFGAEIVPQRANILTHCNAGSLATVDYGTTLGVVRAAIEAGKQVHVWVDETRPRLQGARLTALELMRDGIPMTLIADNAAGMLMRLGRVDLVLFGADRVAANGDVANKIGSYKLAVIARENGVPCYSVVPTPTIDLSLAHGDLIPIEERDAGEVTHIGAEQIAPDGVPVYNPAFDVTPHRYLTGIITEEGICYPPFEMSLRRAVEAAERRRAKYAEVLQASQPRSKRIESLEHLCYQYRTMSTWKSRMATKKQTATSSFGTGKRESHDASAFYGSNCLFRERNELVSRNSTSALSTAE